MLGQAITAHGYPASADPNEISFVPAIILLTILVIYVTLVYAPIAAWLVELFPTRIRYSGDVAALPHRQWLVRRLPATGHRVRNRGCNRQHLLRTLVSDWRGAPMSFVIGLIFLPETKDVDITKY